MDKTQLIHELIKSRKIVVASNPALPPTRGIFIGISIENGSSRAPNTFTQFDFKSLREDVFSASAQDWEIEC